ncbi:hypothetical protein Tco_1177335 [Tanacetum coccineum]
MEVVSGLKNGLENALNGLNIKKISLEDSEKDELVWKSKKGKEDKFNVKQAYEDLRGNGDEVEWSKTIWILIPINICSLSLTMLKIFGELQKQKMDDLSYWNGMT